MTVFRYTFKDTVRKKSFKISSAVIFIVILLIFALLSFFASPDGDDGSDSPEPLSGIGVYYIDEQGLVPGGADALAAWLAADVTPGDAAQLDAYRQQVADDGDLAIVQILPGGEADGGMPQMHIYVKNMMSSIPTDAIAEALSRQYTDNYLREQGVSDEVIARSNLSINYTTDFAVQYDLSGYIGGLVLVMLLFFCVYFYGYGVAMSVAMEKTSRVMETLIVSAKPSRILIGKVLAMGAAGLLQFAGILLTAALGYFIFLPDGFAFAGASFSTAAFSPAVILLIVLYFILGYVLYAVLNSVCGATVSKVEDLNTAMMPVMFIALISFYLAYFSALSGGGALTAVATYLPFTSPFLMPFLLLNGGVSAGAIAGSIVLLLAAIAVVLYVSIRIYSASVLHYGGKLKWKAAYKTKL